MYSVESAHCVMLRLNEVIVSRVGHLCDFRWPATEFRTVRRKGNGGGGGAVPSSIVIVVFGHGG